MSLRLVRVQFRVKRAFYTGASRSGRVGAEEICEAERFLLPSARRPDIIVFVAMEIMSANILRFSRTGTFICCLVLAGALPVLAQVPPSTVERSPAYAQNVARFRLGARVEAFRQSNPISSFQLSSKLEDNIAQAALISDHPTVGYALPAGQTEVVLPLSKIENIDIVSFLNNGAAGTVTISTSNSKLAVGSPQWLQIAKQALTSKVTKIKVDPTEAKYVKFTFNVAKSGRIADLAVYSTASLTVASIALAGGGGRAVDGKDAKDFGGGKEAKEVAEGPPEEGPPPNLPEPPPFVFVPEVSP